MQKKPTYKELEQRVKQLEKDAISADRSKERIKHINAVLTSIRNVSQLITKENNPEQLIKKACQNLTENRGYHNAWIILTDKEKNLLSSAESGMGNNLPLITEKIKSGDFIYCFNHIILQSSKPDLLAIKNPASLCTDCPISHLYKDRGAMAVRLEHNNKVYGILTVSIPVTFSEDTEEHGLFREVAGDIAFALYSIEGEKKRRQAEEMLLRARDDLECRVKERTKELEFLSVKLLSAQEEERKRIAADLHDGIGQSLSAIKFTVENALEQINGTTDTGMLKQLVPMLQKASEEVRTIVMNLRPSVLDDLGILAAISWFCRQFRTVYSFIRVEEHVGIRESDVPDVLKTTIFRILQEAMNNIAKHSKASLPRAFILRKEAEIIELVISDNGRGFNVGTVIIS